ncbi:MAG TPA: malectin domain-containing carbohydrate-binding protein [Rariglobus sp.]|jgi:hypothetical protein|nr:malectin domain-containing carbohydrate-binding protein [Rariglobus sp.]
MPRRFVLTAVLALVSSLASRAQVPEPSVLTSGWQMQDSAKVSQTGDQLSQTSFAAKDWYKATVPGTILTTLVNNKVYPEPTYGENGRPEVIPDTLCRTDWWYRGVFPVPSAYAGRKVWLNFDGINYAAEVWVNGKSVGTIKGAFIRGIFDISSLVAAGKEAAIAVRVSPQPHPGIPAQHTMGAGNGPIGGVTRLDGPTFACSIGWDWMPGIPDRETGIWSKVFLSSSGPVIIKNPYVTTDLPLPRTDSADITIQATVQNTTDKPQTGVLKGSFGDVSFEKEIELTPGSAETVNFDPKSMPQLRVQNPKLWWPHGYGEPNLYSLHLTFELNGKVSDGQDVSFGVREFSYDAPGDTSGTGSLALSVNGVRIYCKGGNWGMDDSLKRIPRERLEAFVRLHQEANFTMIRNWGGQSTSDDLYDLCDKYGILLWDEFFQFNSASPLDLDLYMANCRDKILRYRNHPSVAIWCARNEATPPKYIDEALRGLLVTLDGTRWYQSNSGGGRGVNSGGPYEWQTPLDYYNFSENKRFNKHETFKTEIGGITVPTLESIQGMMPEKDWNVINDDWAQHDFTAGSGRKYPGIVTERYGKIANLADFARKGQMMNYEGYRALFEGRQAQMFKPVEGILLWMSHPAQPSFVWQIYHYDLDPTAAFFGSKVACEPVHIQFNEIDGGVVQVINNLPAALAGAKAHLALYNLDGTSPYQHDYDVNAASCAATTLGKIDWPAGLSPVHFVKLELRDAAGKLISDNFYWRGSKPKPDDLTALDTLLVMTLATKAERRDAGGKVFIDVTLKNPGPQVALMAHLQLHRGTSKARVLPAYYSDNYVSLVPNEQKTITIEADASALNGEKPLVLIDGWNIAVRAYPSTGADVALNENAQVSHWPKTGLPFNEPKIEPQDEVHMNVGGFKRDGFAGDPGYLVGVPGFHTGPIDMSGVPAGTAPEPIYQTVRWGNCVYPFELKPKAGQTYTVRLYFTEYDEKEAGKRVFNISINGQTVLTDLDVFKETGGRYKALMKQFTGIVPDANRMITIGTDKGKKGTPQVCGIEILKEPVRE